VEEEGIMKEAKKISRSKRKIILIVAAAVLIVLIITLTVFGMGIYKYNWQNRAIKIMTSVVPYPAAIVNWTHFVTVAEFRSEVDSILNYYKQIQKFDFTKEENKEMLKNIQKQTLDSLIENEILKEQAKKYKLKVTSQEIDEEYNKIVETSGGEEQFLQTLKSYYKWTPQEFKQKVKIQLLKEKLEEAVAKDDEINRQARDKIEGILRDLKAGASFTELAKEFSEDGSAVNGGDLGFFSRGSGLPSEFEEAAFALEEDQLSDIVKTKLGYHIIKLEEKKDDQVHVRHILIKPKDFQKWLSEEITQAKVFRFLAK
jgi:parvulin-like peptidyl-prolyl isomerase